MNCQACRQHLEPFLDDELSVKDNVAVLEHVTACTPCQHVFNAEKRIREALQASLGGETCPEAVADRAFAAIRADARGAQKPPWKQWILWAPPIAAAITGAFFLPRFLAEAPSERPALSQKLRKQFAKERTHDHSAHGEFLAWAGLHYDELTDDLAPGQILNSESLQLVQPRSRAVASLEEFERVVRAKVGVKLSLPPSFVEGGRILGGELLAWDEGWVPQFVVEYGDRELVVYELSNCLSPHLGCQMMKLFATFHPVESEPGKEARIAVCDGCDAVLVLYKTPSYTLRGYLLLSRHGRDFGDDWMLEKARKLLD
jgi:hypothetical protein